MPKLTPDRETGTAEAAPRGRPPAADPRWPIHTGSATTPNAPHPGETDLSAGLLRTLARGPCRNATV